MQLTTTTTDYASIAIIVVSTRDHRCLKPSVSLRRLAVAVALPNPQPSCFQRLDIMFGSNVVPASSQQQQPMMMCMPPNMMPPNMMMRLPQPMTQAPQGGTDFSSIPGYRKGMETAVTTGSIAIWKLPKVRLTECLEFVEPKLDATLTACVPSKLI